MFTLAEVKHVETTTPQVFNTIHQCRAAPSVTEAVLTSPDSAEIGSA
jgi:hypothetical protein